MEDYPRDSMSGHAAPTVVVIMFLAFLVWGVYAFVQESTTTVTVWVPPHKAHVPDVTKPTFIDGGLYYFDYEEIDVPGRYERRWAWKK